MNPQQTLLHRIIRNGLPVLILAGGAGGFLALASLRKPPASTDPEQMSALVETVRVRSADQQIRIDIDGEVTPFRELTLAAEVAGRIDSKSEQCQAGHFVEKGTLLLRIDPRDYQLEIRRLQQLERQASVSIEELDVERANNEELIKLTKEEWQLQQNNLNRRLDLRAKNAASAADVDLARSDELRARNSLLTLENQQRILAARRGRLLRDKDRLAIELERATLDFQRTEIHAPIDGVIIEDVVEEDSFVQRGTQLVRMEDTSRMEVRFHLRMKELRWLWQSPSQSSPGLQLLGASFDLPPIPVEISLSLDGQEFSWEAKLARYDGAGINAATRTVPCIAVVEDPRAVTVTNGEKDEASLPAPPTLMRGMFVRVSIPVTTQSSLLLVPQIALQPGNGLWLVRDDKLHLAKGRVVHAADDDAVLLAENDSIVEGDEVVVSPLPFASTGLPVRRRELGGADDRPREVSAANEKVKR